MLNRLEDYRNTVLMYEQAHAQISKMVDANRGDNMSEADLAHYRELARHRDELFNEMMLMEQQLSEDSDEKLL
jgi:hypothetical protein